MIGIGPNLAPRPTANVWSSGANLDFMFAEDASVVPRTGRAQLACTRAGATATRFIAAGLLEVVPANTPRLNHDPSVLRYENWLTYSGDLGNAIWNKVRATIETGHIAVDGTATAVKLIANAESAVEHYLRYSVVADAVGAGVSFTYTFEMKPAEYSIGVLRIREADGSFTSGFFNLLNGTTNKTGEASAVATMDPLPDGWWRCRLTFTEPTSATGNHGVYVYTSTSMSSAAHDGDGVSGIYIGRPQINSGSIALPYKRTGATPFPKTYACRGLLVEETRTNSLSNSMMVGAVAGTPGTIPTGWGYVEGISGAAISGVSARIAAVTVVNGVTCLDVAYSGTATGTAEMFVRFAGSTAIASSNGQSWTHGVSLAVVAGALPGLCRSFISGRDSGGNFLTDSKVALDVTSQLTRFTHPHQMANAAIAYSYPGVSITFTTGQAVSFTLRIAMPQYELGAFATSFIPTSAAAVTRNADVVTLPTLTSWYNPIESTNLAEFTVDQFPGSQRIVSFNNETANERIELITPGTLAQVQALSVDGGVTVASGSAGVLTARQPAKAALAIKQDDFALSVNGGAVVADSEGTMPTPTQLALGRQINSGYLNGHIRRFAYWRTRLPNADLQQLTA